MWPKLKNTQEYALNNVLMKMRTGSHLYGTNVATSDIDYVGLFSPHLDTIYGYAKCDEVDCSIVSKKENGKNDSDAVDFKLYEIRKFLHLLSQGNPNIHEMIWCDEKNLLETSEVYQLIRMNRELFVFKDMYSRFVGYAYAQKQKMLIKSENVEGFVKFLDLMDKQTHKHDPLTSIDLSQTEFSINEDNYIKVGDIKVQAGFSIKNAADIVQKRYARASYRKDSILKYGFDNKFAMNLIRLLYEGISLMKYGQLLFPLPEREQLLDIRNGKYTLEEILKLAEDLETEARHQKSISRLPEKIDMDRYRELFIEVVLICADDPDIKL